jgi:hypothetical protein
LKNTARDWLFWCLRLSVQNNNEIGNDFTNDENVENPRNIHFFPEKSSCIFKKSLPLFSKIPTIFQRREKSLPLKSLPFWEQILD